jgi:FkbM family methyltransferase
MLRDRLYPHTVSLIAGHRHSRIVRGLSWAANAYTACYQNQIYDADVNGEHELLRRIARFSPSCVFDVGANVGNWSTLALETFAQAEVHAFEIVPDTSAKLLAALGSEPRAHLNEFGLADEPGELEIKYFPANTEVSGLIQVYEGEYELRSCRVETGDAYCDARGIEHIDLLKIDVEGADLAVLRGFEKMLGRGGVDVIQFEYGRPNIEARALLRDFYELFEGLGFLLGKLYPDGVEFRPYAIEHEDFRGPNYVAVRGAREDLVTALSAG